MSRLTPASTILPAVCDRLAVDLATSRDRLRGVVAGNWSTLSSEDRAILGEVAALLGAWSGDLAFVRATDDEFAAARATQHADTLTVTAG